MQSDKQIWYTFLAIMLMLEWFFPILSFIVMKKMEVLWVVALSISVAIFFGLIFFIKDKLYKQYLDKKIIWYSLLSAFLLGLGGLGYFYWIKYSSPGIASILLLMQILYAFFIFNIFGKEPYSYKQLLGASLMLIGWFLVIYEWESFINTWAVIMLVSSLIFTFWNYYTKKATKLWASPFFLLLNRNLIVISIVWTLGYIYYGFPPVRLVQENFLWIFLIGFLSLFVSKILWIKALERLDSLVAISSFPLISVFAVIFSYFILWDILTMQQLFGFIPILIWTILLTYKRA